MSLFDKAKHFVQEHEVAIGVTAGAIAIGVGALLLAPVTGGASLIAGEAAEDALLFGSGEAAAEAFASENLFLDGEIEFGSEINAEIVGGDASLSADALETDSLLGNSGDGAVQPTRLMGRSINRITEVFGEVEEKIAALPARLGRGMTRFTEVANDFDAAYSSLPTNTVAEALDVAPEVVSNFGNVVRKIATGAGYISTGYGVGRLISDGINAHPAAISSSDPVTMADRNSHSYAPAFKKQRYNAPPVPLGTAHESNDYVQVVKNLDSIAESVVGVRFENLNIKPIPSDLPLGASYDKLKEDLQYLGHQRNADGSVIPYVQMSMGMTEAESDMKRGHSMHTGVINQGQIANTHYL